MTTIERTRRLASTAVVGGGLALALAVSGCASEADSTGGSGSVSRPATTTPAGSASASSSPVADPTTSSSPRTSGTSTSSSTTTTSAAALSTLLLRRSDLPGTFEKDSTSAINGALVNESLRTCAGVGSPSDDTIVDSRTSPSYRYTYHGAASTSTRYETQAAADADAALLSAPKAGQCFRSVLLEQFRTSGAATSSLSVTVRPGTNNGPKNEAGLVRLSFVEDQGREGRPTIRIAVYYLTGPRTLTSLILFSSGNPFDQALSTTLLYTLAERTAGA